MQSAQDDVTPRGNKSPGPLPGLTTASLRDLVARGATTARARAATRDGRDAPAEPRDDDGAPGGFPRVSWTRVVGYGLYDTWILACFYNTFMLNADQDFRALLYVNMIVSMTSLSLTLGLLPALCRRADKWVLSKTFVVGGGVAMGIATALSMPAGLTSPFGIACAVVGAITTGVASGVLLLGWFRLFADLGSRLALLEASAAWLLAAGVDAVLTLMPRMLASVIVIVIAVLSALMLRTAAMRRPPRRQTERTRPLLPRTKRLFLRGLTAFFATGFVAGMCDMLAGFRFLPVPDHYELLLALCLAVIAAVLLVVAMTSRHAYVLSARRVTSLLLMLGSATIPFLPQLHGLPSIVIFGAYQGVQVMLVAVCVDVCERFDLTACRAFGPAFGAMFAGEVLGDLASLLLTEVMGLQADGLLYVSSALSVVVAFVALFLFTDTDLIETGVGEMTDDDDGVGAAVVAAASAEGTGAGDAAAPLTTDQVCAVIAERYGMTARESEVLALVLRGRTIARIQQELHISQGTVSTHTRHIYQKTGSHNRQGLLDLAEAIAHERAQAGDAAHVQARDQRR
ncbi:hypothetical protein I3I95_02655 [bacterium]|nr:hypothetical protein [bacterium]